MILKFRVVIFNLCLLLRHKFCVSHNFHLFHQCPHKHFPSSIFYSSPIICFVLAQHLFTRSINPISNPFRMSRHCHRVINKNQTSMIKHSQRYRHRLTGWIWNDYCGITQFNWSTSLNNYLWLRFCRPALSTPWIIGAFWSTSSTIATRCFFDNVYITGAVHSQAPRK